MWLFEIVYHYANDFDDCWDKIHLYISITSENMMMFSDDSLPHFISITESNISVSASIFTF